MVDFVKYKSNFSIMKGENYFSHTMLGPGYRSCDLSGRAVVSVASAIAEFPAHPPVQKI